MSDRTPLYPHRCNGDGSYDSICRRCFATVGTGRTEAELELAEALHVCNLEILYQHGLANSDVETGETTDPRCSTDRSDTKFLQSI
jgi:hypothetical protein